MTDTIDAVTADLEARRTGEFDPQYDAEPTIALAAASGHWDIVARFLALGVDPNCRYFDANYTGGTPLHYAAWDADAGMVRMLLAFGADPHAKAPAVAFDRWIPAKCAWEPDGRLPLKPLDVAFIVREATPPGEFEEVVRLLMTAMDDAHGGDWRLGALPA